MNWHSSSIQEVYTQLDTDKDGLTDEQADKRLEENGENVIEDSESVSVLSILIDQFTDFLIYLLIAAMFVSLGIGLLPGHEPEYVDAGLIMLILIANGVFGFIQDYKAEKSIEALKDMSNPNATVIRGGEQMEIDSRKVVPGDIVVIEQGDAIPADCRLIEQSNLETDESSLTGESTTVSKSVEPVGEDAALADRKNMAFMNTTAVKGRAKAVVVETGMATEVGDIAEQINEAEDTETPFQKEVNELGQQIGYGISAIIMVVALTQLIFTSTSPVSILLVAVTLAVAAVPEGLPAVVTLTLALGSKKMLKKDALVRSLPVVESLGSVDVIVTDKTGTLTEDSMTVKKAFFDGKNFEVTGQGLETVGEFKTDGKTVGREEITPLVECGYICNNAKKNNEEGYFGDPTEVALLVSAEKAGATPEVERVDSVPFSSDRKRMTVVTDQGTAYMKGAPETVLERCDRILEDGKEVELTDEKREKILEKNQEFASEALRVLGFARKDAGDYENPDDLESEMVFLGLQGMIDPPRAEVKEAIEDSRSAGIRVVMATGDNVETAKAIGEQIGFNPEGAITGPEVEEMSDEQLQKAVEDVEVFARVSPEHKVRIAKALKANGHNVAMTGDGVNDAPALKASDVGVAMGQRGTDVAKQSADMVLQDDNFVTIRDAIAEGRGIFDNIRKFVNYLLSANAGEVLVVFLGVMLGAFLYPEQFTGNAEALILTPVMLLWINFVTDGMPALALGADPKSDGIMDRAPRGSEESVINKRMMASIVGMGGLMAATGLPAFFYTLQNYGLIAAQTVLFTFLVLAEMARIQVIRRRYNQPLSSNKWLVGALSGSILLQLAVLYTPISSLFEVASLGIGTWGAVLAGTVGFMVLSFGMSAWFDRLFSTRF
ncbi:cation-translocating P-type ATPase [Candidatus Nanohalococcus occultus]|uniref:Cation transport ATPase n=1 Tax=Candidatus Nanohalococcus occultus TaxID=2978047 RepID=A0ABY8CGC9_9ARCH|nr:Cation transport ATPase [Candidatus Nanohaloarchaeota archaeon SVXNc]